jgi:hypothetical protein
MLQKGVSTFGINNKIRNTFMKKIFQLNVMKTIVSFAVIVTLFYSCRKPCDEVRGIEGAGLNITFINSLNNEYFYPELPAIYPSIYKLDSLKVKDSNGKILRTPGQLNQDAINAFKKYYVVEIYPIFIPGDDAAAFNSEQTKTIFIKYNYNTYDTLKLVYKTVKEKCANKYAYLKAYYKGNLISETYNSYSQGLNFKINH